MKIEVLPDADAVARRSAAFIAAEARSAVNARGRFTLAVSGGRTPWVMLRALVREDVPWEAVQILQVDERVAPEGHPDRNLTRLRESLLEQASLKPEQIHAMPVGEDDLDAAAKAYAGVMERLAGPSRRLDLVHLGLGPDGHTASLIPGSPVLEVRDAPVAVTEPYQGRRRMTLTLPVLDGARRILWVVTGEDKGAMLLRLSNGDTTIPAGCVSPDAAVVMADSAAARLVT